MGHFIHRKGTRYRVWSTVVDKYISRSMTRGQMVKYLIREGLREFEQRIDADVSARMSRVDRLGTSSLMGDSRDATKWDTERCDHCGGFHHDFELRLSDGMCRSCGEPEGDTSHKSPCKKKR